VVIGRARSGVDNSAQQNEPWGQAMTTHDVAAALQRVEAILQRRPEVGLHDDTPATACWASGMRVVTRHANGTQIPSDMPTEFGGTGDRITPGWLFRAGLASCAATSIAMLAAAEGIALTTLEVCAGSRTDSRGMLGMADASGEPVSAAPCDLTLNVHIAAEGIAPQRLRALVEAGLRRSPVPSVLPRALPLALQIDVDAA
jgi:uncharacterized OsmC-like protein